MNKYYDEGDTCPECGVGMLVITQCNETGYCSVVCQDCNFDATDLERNIYMEPQLEAEDESKKEGRGAIL